MLCCGVDVAANGVLLALKDTAFVVRQQTNGPRRWQVAEHAQLA